jgi:hypothetical protein
VPRALAVITERRRHLEAGGCAGLAHELDDALHRAPDESFAVFAEVSAGRTVRVPLPGGTSTTIAWGMRASLRPLVAAVRAGAPAGCVVVSKSGVRLLEWSHGALELLSSSPLPERPAGHELVGPARAHPRAATQAATGAHVESQRDLFERREAEHRERFLAAEAAAVLDASRRHAWQDLLLVGAPRTLQPLADALGTHVTALAIQRDVPPWEGEQRLAAEVGTALAAHRMHEDDEGFRRALETAAAGGPGAAGVPDVLTALEQARVDVLYLPLERALAGWSTPDGRLLPPAAAATADVAVAEPQLADAMIGRALDQKARVVLVQGEGEALHELDGVAALLRW